MKIVLWVDTIFIAKTPTEMILINLTLPTIFFAQTCMIVVAMYLHGFHYFWLLFAI